MANSTIILASIAILCVGYTSTNDVLGIILIILIAGLVLFVHGEEISKSYIDNK